MERLTKVLENGQVVMQCDKCSRRGTIKCDALPCRNMVKDRLGAIEYILGEDYDLDRIREIVEADRDGRCVVLPCKIGSLVYAHTRKLDGQDCVIDTDFWWSDIPEIGKTVFLTREAAEAALKGERDG